MVDRVGRISKGVLKNESYFEVIFCPEEGLMNGERINLGEFLETNSKSSAMAGFWAKVFWISEIRLMELNCKVILMQTISWMGIDYFYFINRRVLRNIFVVCIFIFWPQHAQGLYEIRIHFSKITFLYDHTCTSHILYCFLWPHLNVSDCP